MEVRTSFDKYSAAVSRALNVVAIPQGGLTLCPGTRFVNEVADSTNISVLRGIETAAGTSYMLEWADQLIRFYKGQARVDVPSTSTTITNGTFTGSIAGWTDRSTGTATVTASANKALFTGTSDGYAWVEQALTVAGGDQSTIHVIRFVLTGNPGSKATCQVGTTSKGFDLMRVNNLGMGHHTISFTPGTGTVYFQVINKGSDSLSLDTVVIMNGSALSLPSPYLAANTELVRSVQSNDVFYLFHGSYRPYRLDHRGDYSWSMTTAFFDDGPYQDINPDIDLDKANLVENSSFDGGIQGWTTSSNHGSVEYDGSQGVVFFHLQADTGGQSAQLRQQITTPVSGNLHIMHFQAVGRGQVSVRIGTASSLSDIMATTEYDPGWYSVSFTPGASSFWIQFGAQTGTQGNEDIPGVGGVFIYTNRANLLQASGTTGSITVTALTDFTPFVSTDVNRLIRLEHAGREAAWGVITAYTNSQTVTVLLYRDVASTVPTETWQLGSWSDTSGWPATGTLYQQRLLTMATTDQPQTFWGSQSGDFQNMRADSFVGGAKTVEDDDAFVYTLAAKKGAPIRWASGSRRLILGTAIGQCIISSRGAALSPTDLIAEFHTSVRAASIEPVEINTATLFTEGSQQAVDDIGYDYQIDGYRAADLNILADHVAGAGFSQLVYQARPYGLAWARKSDGTLAVLTYKRDENVVGWGAVAIAGSSAGDAVVESISVKPGAAAGSLQTYTSADRDELWLQVKRTINGSTKRYIEVMEGFYRGPNRALYTTQASWLTAAFAAQADAFYVDCGITYSGGSTSTITGLSHLNGESVMVNGSGAAQGPFTVSGGSITLTTAVTKAQAGLSRTWRIRGLKLPFGAQTGTAVGQSKNLSHMVAILLDSASFSYGIELTAEQTANGDPEFFSGPNAMPTNGALFTGETALPISGAGGDSDPRIVLKGSQPLPWTLLGIAPKVATNEGG